MDKAIWRERPHKGEPMTEFVDRLVRTYKVSPPKAVKVARHVMTLDTLERARSLSEIKPVIEYLMEHIHD